MGRDEKDSQVAEKDYLWAIAIIAHNNALHDIERYLKSEEYSRYLEYLKRREREKILEEVTKEIAKEKEALLQDERKKMQSLVQQEMDHERLILQNRLKLEQYEREQYEQKLMQNSSKLIEIQRRNEQEKVSMFYVNALLS